MDFSERRGLWILSRELIQNISTYVSLVPHLSKVSEVTILSTAYRRREASRLYRS
jgi:hypothetical protein